MKRWIAGSALLLGGLAAAGADFTPEEIAFLRQEALQKVEALRHYLEETTCHRERQALVNIVSDYIYLADITGASNAAEVLGMPYMGMLVSPLNFLSGGLRARSRRAFLKHCFQKGEFRPSHELRALLNGSRIREDLEESFVDAPMEEFHSRTSAMGPLAGVYLEIRSNPGKVVPPLDVVDPIAWPVDVPLYGPDGTLNEAFFVRWYRNVFDAFIGEPSEEIPSSF